MKAEKGAIERAARNMIERYGDQATKEIDQRIAELRTRGEVKAQALWTEIRKAVKRFTSNSSGETKH